MKRKRHGAEEIVRKLRDAEVAQSEGKTITQICKQLEISEQTYHRWKKQYGGLLYCFS
ncbi:MAG: helix-turn-helix domain-containing protein [Thermoanaerobaculia bacterium]|nr:helix-turn-helix domain-containing protein [Thermoanaerobaculia bacterium]